uniref:Uncharacterized protein n=1 Tax=Anguilla anguilla TaxID=7936 RepID=A0A0E9RWV9_ANGAN
MYSKSSQHNQLTVEYIITTLNSESVPGYYHAFPHAIYKQSQK